MNGRPPNAAFAPVSGVADGAPTESHRRNALIVFARAPQPGHVKTRLAAELGESAALAIYRCLADRVLRAVQRSGRYSVTVAYTPAGAERELREWLGGSVAIRPQASGDLGARMAGAIADAMAGGAERVVVIGTDCPDVDATVIEMTFERLTDADLVVGPATDGGYYLIGMSRLYRSLFANVPWSSARTLEVTLDRARGADLSIALLEERRDIDTAEDWRAWLASGDRAADSAP